MGLPVVGYAWVFMSMVIHLGMEVVVILGRDVKVLLYVALVPELLVIVLKVAFIMVQPTLK